MVLFDGALGATEPLYPRTPPRNAAFGAELPLLYRREREVERPPPPTPSQGPQHSSTVSNSPTTAPGPTQPLPQALNIYPATKVTEYKYAQPR
jgi:hypothetical protein